MPEFLIDGLSWLQDYGLLVTVFVLFFVVLCGPFFLFWPAIRKAWLRGRELEEEIRARKLAEAAANAEAQENDSPRKGGTQMNKKVIKAYSPGQIIKACSPGQITALLVGTGICLLLLALHNPFGGYQTHSLYPKHLPFGVSPDLGFAHWISLNAVCKWVDEPIELIGLMLPVIAFALIVFWVIGLRNSRAEPPASDDA